MAQRQRQRDYRKQIDFVFYHEQVLREAIYMARNKDSVSGLKLVGENSMSDPTASKAVGNLTLLPSVVVAGHFIKFPERWIIVVDKTYDWSKQHKDCRYEIARRRYSGEDYRQTCLELNISNSTRRRLFELVQIYAALQAVQLGLIRV